MVKNMDDPNMSGRQTPGIGTGGKPSTPGPNQSGSNPMGSNMASQHGAQMRYGGYGSPMHPGYGPQMMPQGGPGGGHPGIASHHAPYGQGPYGAHPGSHQMHQQQQQQQHGGQLHGMPMSPMMPPPSQYPNKAQPPPPSPGPGQQQPPATAASAGVNPSAPPSPHQQPPPPPHMMSSDRSAMSYYGQQRFGGPAQHGPPPPQPPPPGSTGHQPPNAYYMRPPMGGAPQGGKHSSYYGPNGPPPHAGYGGGQDMRMSLQQQQHQQQLQHQQMMSGQHPQSHHQHQMMMHHHQMQQQAGYGPAGHMGGDSGRESMAAAPSTSVTHSAASSAPPNSHSSDGHRHPQPPPIMDEVSQTSTASSQAADDSCASADMPMSNSSGHKASKHHLSHPSTPNTSNLGSPGAASMSSFHDDFDSVSSPSWPRTPASPALNSSQYSSESHHHSSSKRNDSIQKLYEMSDEPDRRAFLDKYLQFQEERGQPLTQVPTISKIPLDLYRLYMSVRERGGFSEVTKGKLWKECGQICNIANSSSAAYTLRKQYMKHMLHFECKFDRGGIDPAPVILQLDATTNSKKKSAALKASNSAAAAAAANTSTTAASSGSQPRLSPSTLEHQSTSGHSQAGAPPYSGHHPHHSMGPYDMEGHGGFAPPNTSVSAAGGGPMQPYGQMAPPPPHSSAQYGGHPGLSQQHHPPPHPSAGDYPHYLPPHSAASAGHMPPPPTSAAAAASGGQPSTSSSTTPHNESISVKDPFADDDMQAGSNSSPSYPPSRQPHYAMHPGSQGPYYNPQAQSHPGYPEGGHPSHGHYQVEGAPASISAPYGRPPSAAPPESSGAPHPHPHHAHPHYATAGNSAPLGAYQSRMPANGHPSHGYYDGHGGQQQPGQQSQPIPYESHHHQRPPFSNSPHTARPPMAPSPHEHYSGHPGQPPAPHPHSGSIHRYPSSASIPMGYGGPRSGPYNSSQPPHPLQAQQPGAQYSSSAEGFSKGSEPFNQSGPRMQSPLAQRLLAAKESPSSASQSYPVNQPYPNASQSSSPMQPSSGSKGQSPGGHHHPSGPPGSSAYQPMQQQANSNISWMPTSRYGAPKRHPDFAKPSGEHSNFSQPQSAGSGYPGSYQTSQKQNAVPGAPGHPWNRAAEQGSVQYRMGSPGSAGPPYGHHAAYGGNSRAEQQKWHPEGRSPSVPPDGHQSAGEGGRPPNWPHNRYGSADYRNSLHEQFGSGSHGHAHQKMMGGHHFNHRGEAMSGGGGSGGYLMHHHPSPGKIALSNQLAERRGVFQHSPGPPLFAAAAGQHTSGSSQHQQTLMKRDIIFPPNSVEATVPTPTKHRKITSREFTSLGPIDAWRLFMSLKSGLLAESTYALDVLNVYSNDDSSLSYLGLSNMPGLLEVLLEHYKCYLNEMFDNLFEDTEIGFEARQLRYELNNGKYTAKKGETKESKSGVKRKLKWYELARDYEEEQSDERSSDEEDEEDEMGLFLDKHFKSSKSRQVVLTNTTNYTHVTRNGLPVKFKRTKSLFISDYDKPWDQIKNGFAIGYEHWAKGGGETTSHIVSHFEPKESRLRFVQTIKGSKTAKFPDKNGNCVDPAEKMMEVENDKPSDNEVCSTTLVNGDQQHYPKIRDCDQALYLKNRQQPQLEEESYELEESPIVSGRDYHEGIKARVLTVSNLIRNLTFVPGNDVEMVKHSGLLLVLSRLILLHHQHAVKKRQTKTMNLEAIKAMDENTLAELNQKDGQPAGAIDSETMLETEWFRDALHLLRENTLVTLANLSCHLKLAPFPETISLHLLDGILHWATCPSSYAQDSLPSAHYSLSPKRLAYETLTKLSIVEANVDLILATPPWDRLETLLGSLVRSLGRQEEQTMREFSVVLLSNFATEPMAARAMVALKSVSGESGCSPISTIGLLIGFVEQAEQTAMHVANTPNGYQALRETPELAMGTTVDMIRRAAATLRHISRAIENRPLFIQYEARLLSLAMSPILDQSVAVIIADILYESSFVSAKKQLLATEARLAAAQTANGSDSTDAAGPTTGDNSAVANNDNSSTTEHLELKKTVSELTNANTDKQLNRQKEDETADKTTKTANENVSLEMIGKKTVKNGPISPPGEVSSKSSPSENFEKAKSRCSDTLTNVKHSEPVVKTAETSNGLEHKSPLNSSSKNHIGQTKNEFNNNNPANRVLNGVLGNSVHNNDKTADDHCLEPKQPNFYNTNSGYSNSLPLVDFFSGRKGALPHGSPLLMGSDAVKGANNHAKYYPSPYPSSRDHLLPSGKSISSNGVLDEAAAVSPIDAANAAAAKKSTTVSVASAASTANSDLNSAAAGVGASASAPPTTAAIIEASST